MPPNQRDDISFAFQHSSYPTPYGDNTIPGNHPGYRYKRLGRNYAPNPVNASSFTADLHVPGADLGRHGPAFPGDINNNVQSTLLPRDPHNSNYVLDSERGGRRHFDEQRGVEQRWFPSLRQLDPPVPESWWRAPMRRAFGAYNAAARGPEALAVVQRREREAGRPVGRAHVYRRPDHHPVYLGLYHWLNVGTHNEASSAADVNAAAAAGHAVDTPAQHLEGGNNGSNHNNDNNASNVVEGRAAVAERVFLPSLAFITPSTDEARMHGVYLGTRRQPITVPDMEKGSTQAEKRRQEDLSRAREEDIRLVRLLPK